MKIKLLSSMFLAVLTFPFFTMIVEAQGFLPEGVRDIFNLLGPDGSGVASFVTSRVQTGLFIALGLIVLVSVVYALIAAFKYIQSQGDPGKIEEAQKAIKAIFLGIAAMLIAIVGVVLVFVFFGAERPDATLLQTCISAPNSFGCAQCQVDSRIEEVFDSGTVSYDGVGGDESIECAKCENYYAELAGRGGTGGAGVGDEANCTDPGS